MRPTRRQFATSLAALGAASGLAGALPAGSPGRRFLFVFNHGGWDTTRVLSPMFDAPGVDVEAGAERWSIGGLDLVDHPSRPSVRAFFERHHERVALVHGVLVPSVAHEVCTRLVLTGSTRNDPDWAARIGAAESDRYVLPSLLLDAPSFPEDLGLSVARAGANGQLDGLVDGSILDGADQQYPPLSLPAQGAVDRFVRRRALAAAADPRLRGFDEATARAIELESHKYALRFATGGDLASRTAVAVDTLAAGLSRVVAVGWPSLDFPWDSHYDNDAIQAVLWEQLFAGLLGAMDQLSAAALLEDTVVVVLSEMGRTPALNAAGGKDHWPWASLFLFGGGVRGGTVGAYNDGFAGLGVDRATGELRDDRPVLDPATVGATLLALAGLEPDVEPLAPLVP